jgi:hypothetical protein
LYPSSPTVTITGGGGTGAAASAQLASPVGAPVYAPVP